MQSQNVFTYELKTDGLTAKLEKNQINLYNGEELAYTISAPVMQDANNEMSINIMLGLDAKDGKQYVTAAADKEWLSDPARVYPVKIDPSISGALTTSNSFFTTVEEYQPTTIVGDNGYQYVGYDNGLATGTIAFGPGHGICRDYASFDISSVPVEARIDSATFSIYQNSYFFPRANALPQATVALYSVAGDWGSPKTWNNQPKIETQTFVTSQQVMPHLGYLNFDITELVNDWVQGILPNKGIALRAIDETGMQAELFASPKNAQTNPNIAPTWTVNWSIPDPVDVNYPLNNLTINLRPMTEKDAAGKQRFDGVFADGVSTPDSNVAYYISPDAGFSGNAYAGYSYRYPDSGVFEAVFPNANKYKDKLSNWESGNIFTNPRLDTLYTFRAIAADAAGNQSDEKQSDSFIVYKIKQQDTIPYIANYYGVPLNTIMLDNRVQDTLLVENNTLFIRNPNQNAEIPYNPAPLTDAQKRQIDGALRGRSLKCEYGYEPVNLNTGNFYMDKTDSTIPDLNGSFNIERTYNSAGDGYNSLFGRNWSFAYSESLSKLEDGTILYSKGDGKLLFFKPDGNGGYTSPYDTSLKLKLITYEDGDTAYTKYEISDKTGEVRQFNIYGLLTGIVDSLGRTAAINYDENYKITSITSPSGKVYEITINNSGDISQVTLPNGGILEYEYDSNNNLVKYTDAEGKSETYQYNAAGEMTSWIDKDGNRVVKNEYDSQGRVISQYDANENKVTLAYSDGKTISTDAKGNVTNYYYNDKGYTTKIEYPNGAAVEKTYDDSGNLATYKDKSGNLSKYEYDSDSNLIKETRADGLVKSTEYSSLNKPVKITDFDGKAATYEYDKSGNLIKTTNNAGIAVSYEYDSLGRVVKVTDGRGSSTSYTYDGANITGITDREGQTSKLYYSTMNQVTAVEDANGDITRTTYNLRGDKISVQAADGGTTIYTYSGSGKETSETDAKGNITTFAYDNLGNVITRNRPCRKPD